MDQFNQQMPGLTQRQYQPVTIGDWVVTFIVTAIPLVGFIMLIVWAVGTDTHPSKKSWAQATLIFMVISLVLVIAFILVIGFSLSRMIDADGVNWSS